MDESTEKGKKSLEVRLSEIEDKLNELLGVGKRETKASEEDIQTYKKVLRGALDDQAACGINECSKCIVTHCDRCINVCYCLQGLRPMYSYLFGLYCLQGLRPMYNGMPGLRPMYNGMPGLRPMYNGMFMWALVLSIQSEGGEFCRGGTNRSRKRIGEFESLG